MAPAATSGTVRTHYERYPYPRFPLLASVRTCDTYALNLRTLWARFNGRKIENGRVLLAGCGSFSPYPFSVANADSAITALDLSDSNLRRARLHALLHRRTNITYVRGDLLEPATAPGPFHLIDAFGVIHHLDDPAHGLRALKNRLADGGIIRLMVYGSQARREAQAIRTALRILKIDDMTRLKALLRRAPRESRLGRFIETSSEASFDSGLADALLHPHAVTFTIDALMKLIGDSGLTPLLFAHRNAAATVGEEVARLQALENEGAADMNFIVYLGLNPYGPAPLAAGTTIFLNPALRQAVSPLHVRPVEIAPRTGTRHPPLDGARRSFLRSFASGRHCTALRADELIMAKPYLDNLFLGAVAGEEGL